MTALSYRRLPWIAAALVVVALGLLWRRPELGLPGPVSKYGGSALWGAMVFFWVGALAPRSRRLLPLALVAAALAAAVEASQAVHYGPLDAVRGTTIGALLLGRTFSWWDIVAYWCGIAAASLAVLVTRPR